MSSSYRSLARFEPITWHTPAPSTGSISLQDRDIPILWILARDRYATFNQLMHAGFVHENSLRRRLNILIQYGYIQRGHMLWPEPPVHRLNVYTLTTSGAALCAADNSELWTQWYKDWTPPAEAISAKRHMLHELGRNDTLWKIADDCYGQGWDFQWDPGQAGHIRLYPHGPSGQRLELTPDAVVTINQHIWLVEYERSWRPITLVQKMHRYSQYFHYQAWREQFPLAPRVLFILAEQTTQHASLDRWVDKAQALEYYRLYVLPPITSAPDDTTPFLAWPVWHWNPQTHQREPVSSWLFDHNGP